MGTQVQISTDRGIGSAQFGQAGPVQQKRLSNGHIGHVDNNASDFVINFSEFKPARSNAPPNPGAGEVQSDAFASVNPAFPKDF
ncbi:MAG: hypothetical protein JO323_02995 [Acidobacteriia bacterium]|nr:hypothetical protein [Terriglobia bacterium]